MSMRPIALMATIALTCGVRAGAEDISPDGKGDRVREAGRVAPRRPPLFPGSSRARQAPILYHGGPVLRNPTIYFIWYGTWTPADRTILETLAAHIGGSPYANIWTTYYDSGGQSIPNTVTFGGSATDDYSQGRSLSDLGVQRVVERAINNQSLPLDQSGIYFVLTASDVTETSGFCTKYCGWHTNVNTGGARFNIAFIGNAAYCPDACETQTVSPNDDPGADSSASVVAHELEESITDPFLNAWYDENGEEVADKCAYTYGATTTLPNGALTNMQLGGLNYLIQQDWLNVGPGRCAQSH
jgi:Phosphate-induced protein 1 conserved region